MVTYQRPRFAHVEFRDASGAVIEYGRRWEDRDGRQPPEETYSVVTHPERFAPLHAVAVALIEYLLQRYDASSREDASVIGDLMSPHDDVVRAVRITPASASAAPLTFAFTSFPGLFVHAGVLHDFHFPTCGCDACDDTAEAVADELEAVVMAVAEGRYQEWLERGTNAQWTAGGWAALPAAAVRYARRALLEGPEGDRAGYQIVAPDGGRRSNGWGGLPRSSDLNERLATAQLLLESLDDGWQPWPLRAE